MGPLPDPWTLAGNAEWADYRVGSDIKFIGQGSAMVLGRIDSANVFADKNAELPSGYVFQVASGGTWSLLSAEYKKPTRILAPGKFNVNRGNWRHLELAFRGDRVSASLDGKVLASIHDDAHTQGMFGIGTGWNRAQFDNVSITSR